MNIDLLPIQERPGDADQVLKWALKLWRSSTIPGFSEENWTDFYHRAKPANYRTWHGNDQELIYVAKFGENVVGTIALVSFDDLEEFRHLSPWVAAFIVNPELRGRGFGTLILSAIEKEAKSLGIERLYLWTEDQASFYKKRGYEIITSSTWARLSFDVLKKELL